MLSGDGELFSRLDPEERRERIERFVAALRRRQEPPRSEKPESPSKQQSRDRRPAPARPVARSEAVPSGRAGGESGGGGEPGQRGRSSTTRPTPRPQTRGRSPIVVPGTDRLAPAMGQPQSDRSSSRERRERLRRIHRETEDRVRDRRRLLLEEEADRRLRRETAEEERHAVAAPRLVTSARRRSRGGTSSPTRGPSPDKADRHRDRWLMVRWGLAPWKRLLQISRYLAAKAPSPHSGAGTTPTKPLPFTRGDCVGRPGWGWSPTCGPCVTSERSSCGRRICSRRPTAA